MFKMYSTKIATKNKISKYQNNRSLTSTVCFKYAGSIFCIFILVIWVLNKLSENDQTLNASMYDVPDYYKNVSRYWKFVMSERPFIKAEEEGTIENYNGTDAIMFYQMYHDLGPPELPLCVLDTSVLGAIEVLRQNMTLDWVSSRLPHINHGGIHVPKGCRAKYKLAILVPFRNREETLAKFLYHMHMFLVKQMLEYRIIVVEQIDLSVFNIGALLNAGFLASQKLGEYHCYIFHNVDLLPLDSRNLYSCNIHPVLLATVIENDYFNAPQGKYYKVKQNFYGGVTMFPKERFKLVNGYSNCYWGEGAENDLFIRLTSKGHCFLRANQLRGRYARIDSYPKQSFVNETTISQRTCQPKQTPKKPTKALFLIRGFSNRFRLVETATARAKLEGLATINYKLVSVTEKTLYTHIVVDISAMDNEITQEMCLKLGNGNTLHNKTN